MYQQVMCAPDGATLAVTSSVPFPAGVNFAIRVRITSEVMSYGVLGARSLLDFEQVMKAELPIGVAVSDIREVSMKDRRLVTAEVTMAQPLGMAPSVSRWAAWEGNSGCITTSRQDASHDELVALFAATPFHESQSAPGIVVDAPIDNALRPIRGAALVGGVAIVELQPRIPEVDALIPIGPGAVVDGGELYRTGRDAKSLLLVTETAVVFLRPFDENNDGVAFASSLIVSWKV